MYKINKRGQSTVEYVLLVAAVIAVVVAFTTSQSQNGFQGTLNTTLGTATNQMSAMADRFTSAEPQSPGATGTGSPTGYAVNVNQY